MTEGSGEQPRSAELQFDKVDVAVPDALRVCARCQARLEREYFEAQGSFVCPACAAEIGGAHDGAALRRALVFGAGAALLGTLIWFLIIKLTDREFGLIAIAVGFLVGYAVRLGSRGRGGVRFQVLAMALTYVSITASYVPLVIKSLGQVDQAGESASPSTADSPGAPATAAADSPPKEAEAAPGAGSVALALLVVFAFALASPFLGGLDNIMGLIIIAIALYEAWRLNKRVVVSGPYQLRADPVAAGS